MLAHFEQMFDITPQVPDIIYHAPHISMFLYMGSRFYRCFSGRNAQNNRTSTLVYRITHQFDFTLMIRTAYIIYFHEIHTPFCIHIKNRIIIFLSTRTVCNNRVIITQPTALLVCTINLVGCNTICSFYRKFFRNGFLGDTTHDMDTEFQPFRMYIICQFFESFPISSRRKTVYSRLVTSEFIKNITGVCLIVSASLVIFHKPTYIYHNIFPTILLQLFSHIISIRLYFFLLYRRSITIPAVPAHRRSLSPFLKFSFCKRCWFLFFCCITRHHCQCDSGT